jgi:hypothetical protein
MMKNRIALAVAALVLALGTLSAWSQTVGAQAEGKVTEEGKPLPNAQVVFTNADNGKTYKTKTDKNGGFLLIGVPYGNYQVDVLGEKGEKLFTRKTTLGTGDTSQENMLAIEIPKGGAAPADNPFGVPDTSAPKLTKEQLAKMAADNKKIAGLNSLIKEAQSAREAQDWPKAENALKQLIAAAPDTSRWDFYMFLGEAQARSNKFQDAVETYDKGVKVAQSLISGSAPADPKIPTLNPATAKTGAFRMLTAEGGAYLKLEKPAEALVALKNAAELDPTSSLASYNLCGVAYNAQKFDDATVACKHYLQLEPSGAHADEVKAFLAQMPQK